MGSNPIARSKIFSIYQFIIAEGHTICLRHVNELALLNEVELIHQMLTTNRPFRRECRDDSVDMLPCRLGKPVEDLFFDGRSGGYEIIVLLIIGLP